MEFEGGTVEGNNIGTWPLNVATTDVPARILTIGTSGQPTVMIDSVEESREAMDEAMNGSGGARQARGRLGD